MDKHNLIESLSYIEITRGTTRPIRLNELLEQRMETFLDRRLRAIAGQTRGKRLEDL